MVWLDFRFPKLGTLKMIMSQDGGRFLAICQMNSILCSSRLRVARLEARAVHGSSDAIDLEGNGELAV